jgi:hypothetical protein
MLDKRISRAQNIKQQANSLNIDVDFFICGNGNLDLKYDHMDTIELPPRYSNSTEYPTWHRRPNAYNAWLCHKKIIINALENNCDFLLILEDDVIFEKDFVEIIDKTDDFFNNNSWDMIYFGWYSNGHLMPTNNPHVYKMNGGAGLHGILLTKKIMEILLQFDPIGPFDWICGTHINPSFNCYAMYPSIITQESGYSYIEGGNLEKPDRNHK